MPTTKRDVIYPKVMVNEVEVPRYDLKADVAKELLGWEETEEKKGHLFVDENKKMIRCNNNIRNRPLREGDIQKLMQSMLEGNWRYNLETMVIGKTGLTLSCQHRLISLVRCQQILDNDQTGHYKEKWPDGIISIPVLIAVGCDEDEETTRTHDNVVPRSIADIMYAQADKYFPKAESKARKELCNIAQRAAVVLWDRTGRSQVDFSHYRNNVALLDFLDNHPKVCEEHGCVHEIWDEKSGLSVVGLGTAAAFLYLMGSSTSDINDYRTADVRSEEHLQWDSWDMARSFWVDFSAGSKGLGAVKTYLASLSDESGAGGLVMEKNGIIVKAWAIYRDMPHFHSVSDEEEWLKENMRKADFAIHKEKDENGIPQVQEWPSAGGIDLGEKPDHTTPETTVTPEQIAAKKEEIKKENLQKMQAPPKPKVPKPKASAPSKNGKNGSPKKPKVPVNKKDVPVKRNKVQEAAREKARKADEEMAAAKK